MKRVINGVSNKSMDNNTASTITITKQEPLDCYEVIDDDDDISELEHLRKLFIGGLAPYTTEDSLKTFYEQWGKVVDVVVMRDSMTKRSRGFGFITYTKAAMVDRAQDARPHIIDGKAVEAKRALPRPERESRETNISVKKIFVGGLKDNHDEECLKEYFAKFGQVISVKILTDRTSGKRRGFAFVEFDDYDAVDKAMLQKTHSIKYVLVDVKKSVYNKEQQRYNASVADATKTVMIKNVPVMQRSNMPVPPTPGYGPPPTHGMPPYAPPMHVGPPPPSYNYWNHGPPPPHYYGGGPYQGPPHNYNWNYPTVPPHWNAGPPPPGPQPMVTNWQPQGQWGPPPAVGGVVPPTQNWSAAPPAAVPVRPPSTAVGAAQSIPRQAANFGTGYQQNYGGGPAKNSNMSANRMNPYGASPHGGYVNRGNVPAIPGYANNYNGVGPSAGPPGVGASVAPGGGVGQGPTPVPPVGGGGGHRY